MRFLLSKIAETYGQRQGVAVYLRGAESAHTGPALPWHDVNWQRETRGDNLITISWVTWQLGFWPMKDKNAQANKFSLASLKKTARWATWQDRCVCLGEPSVALNSLTGLEGPVRKHGEHISCYMALRGLLLRASHSFAFMEGYRCLTGITIEKLYSRVASFRCTILCCFSRLSLWNSLRECLTAGYVCECAIT